MNNILILGGTGFVGSVLCEKLVEHLSAGSARITVPSRRPGHARHLITLPTVELVAADVHNDADLARLVAGRDAVINLVAILHGSPAAFEHVHVRLCQRLAASCLAAGVRRVIHVSALGVSSTAPSDYLRTKAAAEAALTQAAQPADGLQTTLLRPSVIFGQHDSFLNLFARLQAVFPVMPLAGADARFQPVWVNDVASAIIRCLDRPNTIGQVIECAGPGVFTLAELVRLAGELSGHPRPVLPLPMFAGRLQAALASCAPGEPMISSDNLKSLLVPNVASGQLPGLASLGIEATSVLAIAPGYLTASRNPHACQDVWRSRMRWR